MFASVNLCQKHKAGFVSLARQENTMISVDALSKTYVRYIRSDHHWLVRSKEKIQALENVSFTMQKGELVGLIGPNGAGKSTLVKTLTGILTPTSGRCEVLGFVPWRDRRKFVRHIGTVFGQRTQLWWDIPVSDSLELLRDIYDIDNKTYLARLGELSERLELKAFLHTPLRQLSLGQRMRAELCASLLHGPDILFLDEPTIGLDAVSKLGLRDFLLEENTRRLTTVLLTTHDTSDMTSLCGRALVLGHGKLLYDGNLVPLLERYDREKKVVCRFTSAPDLSGLPPMIRTEKKEGSIAFSWEKETLPIQKAISSILACGPVGEINMEETSADELIARMYKEMRL